MSETHDRLPVFLIAAMARNRVIGRGGEMPWRIPADFKFFKRTTMGCPMIMGRKTFESLPGLLPGRAHVVITRSGAWTAEGAQVVHSLEEAFTRAEEIARAEGGKAIAVIGGGEIYRLALPHADIVHLTEIDAEIEGDATFPELDPAQWREAGREVFPDDPRADYPATRVTWVRV